MEAPNYSKEQINEKIYKIDLLMEEIEDQKNFFKTYGSTMKMICSLMQVVQKRLWLIIITGIIAAYLGIKI